MRIICIPFAGGSKYSYSGFYEHAIKKGLRIIPVEYPGRGARFKENCLEDIHSLTEDVYRQIEKELNGVYCIYGHSMGAIVTYLLTHKIIKRGRDKPVYLFVSGCGGPSRKPDEAPKHLLSKDDFRKKLLELGGCPEELLNNQLLFDTFEPVLRADFRMTESFIYEEKRALDIPMTVLIGKDETTSYEDATAWKKETSGHVEVLELPGNHFFFIGKERSLVDIFYNRLNLGTFI